MSVGEAAEFGAPVVDRQRATDAWRVRPGRYVRKGLGFRYEWTYI